MANYATLIAAIQSVITTNGNNEITGALLQQSLITMINSLGADYQFAGFANPETTPGTPDQKVFYIGGAGTYPNFNSAVIPDGHIGALKYNGSWSLETVLVGKNYDSIITQLENQIFDIKAGLVLDDYKKLNILSISGLGVTSTGIKTRETQTLFYYPIAVGKTINIRFSLLTTSGIAMYVGITPTIPAVNVAVSQYEYISTSLRFVSITAQSSGYLCFSITTEAIESVNFYGENDGAGATIKNAIDSVAYDVLKLKEETTVGDRVSIAHETINGLFVGSSKIEYNASRYLYFVPIAKGQTVRVNYSSSSNVRYGITRKYPQQETPIVEGYGTGSSASSQKTLSATENGYCCVSFDVLPTSVAFSIENTGIGGAVAELDNKVAGLSGIKREITGRGQTSISESVTVLAGKRYHLHLDNFKSGHTSGSYIIFRINVGGENIITYYGTNVVPQDFYFETGENVTTVTLTIRQATGEILYLNFTEAHNPPIFDYNDYNNQIVRLEDAHKKISSSALTPFVLLHFTDIHADSENLSRLLGYYNAFKPKIDDIIHTGDSVRETVDATSFDFWNEIPGTAQILNVIGNHDVWYSEGFTPETNYPYNTYFKPFIDNGDWGTIVQPQNAEQDGLCYYYKDYTAKKIRLIVIDYRSTGDQLTWFESVLADAITNSLSVIVCVHYMPSAMTVGFNTPFNISPFVDYSSYLSASWVNAVDTFIGNGGDFVCWLTGHAHRDYAGYYQGTNGRQIILSLDTAATRNDGYVKYRAKQSKSQDAFNIFCVNNYKKLITLWRVGNDRDALQRHIGSLCVNYSTGEMIYTD